MKNTGNTRVDKSIIICMGLLFFFQLNVHAQTNNYIKIIRPVSQTMHQPEIIFTIETRYDVPEASSINSIIYGLKVNGHDSISDGPYESDLAENHFTIEYKLDENESSTFQAWFYLESNPEDTIHSDVVSLKYIPNTKPVIAFDPVIFDKISKSGNLVLQLNGEDDTGHINEFRVRVNNESWLVHDDIIPDSGVTFSHDYPLQPGINHIWATARDNIENGRISDYEYFLWSDTIYTRVVYMQFDPSRKNYCYVDSSFAIDAIPAGGRFTGPGILNQVNLFNPYLAGSGTHQLTYTFNTPADTASLSIEVTVEPPYNIEGPVMVCHNAREVYSVQITGQNDRIIGWEVMGGSYETVDEQTIEVYWTEKGKAGHVIAHVEKGVPYNCQYPVKKLIAIDYDAKLEQADIALFGSNLLVCNINEARYYQWYKNDISIEDATKSYFYDEAFDPNAIYCVRYWNSDKCMMHACFDPHN